MRRALNARHIRFIALGSVIGTGLSFGLAAAIHWAGPSALVDAGGPSDAGVDSVIRGRFPSGPWLMPRSFLDSEARWFPEGSLADLPNIEVDRSRWNILGWELEPGDAVFFHMLTLHASGGESEAKGVLSPLPR